MKEEKADEREAQMELIMKQRKAEKRKYFHGKYHSLIQQEDE